MSTARSHLPVFRINHGLLPRVADSWAEKGEVRRGILSALFTGKGSCYFSRTTDRGLIHIRTYTAEEAARMVLDVEPVLFSHYEIKKTTPRKIAEALNLC
ncbi:MAG: hypothetical protein KGQ41_07350 [Alphaproteobacteria bacterium]|nr:hypothetical protein [Alphaproteobacteria bacterium]